ncbi:hypothetical protein BKA65DRAFT_580352 [Rhexocercosporidium sp. MPI-PUGE-AT-0058]|nr:hypothetical protein BKA65DRAFT_580352 [Rhexocercosporidium sp. MPI-PUGE-AT-0058]
MNRPDSPTIDPVPLRNHNRPSEPEAPQILEAHSESAESPQPKARPGHRKSAPSPNHHWSERETSLRKVSDTVLSSVRSVSGSIRSLGRRLITPPTNQTPTAARQPPRRSSSTPLPGFTSLLTIEPQDFSVWKPTIPVLVEYMSQRHGSKPNRNRTRSSGVVYLSTDPLDTKMSFVVRARAVAVGDERLFHINIRPRDEFVDLWVCWNQGCSDERVDSRIVGDGEFRRVVELMAARGWRDRFLLECRVPRRH